MKKTRIKDLACFGGEPLFAETLHVGRPNIGDREKFLARVNRILDDRWLTNSGPFVREFEARLAAELGVKHCIAMCNGTVALEIAIRALGMTGEIIVPSFTFVATAHALQWQGLSPCFCDICTDDYTLDPERVESLINERTKGIIAVHTYGTPARIEALESLAGQYRLTLLFDAAHAFGCSHGGCMIGNFGDAEVFSFHATKFVNAFEGGAVATNNDELAMRVRRMKNFGFTGEFDQVDTVGTNGKMNEVSAAMGLTSLDNMGAMISVNHSNYEAYQTHLAGIPGLKSLAYDADEKRNYQYVVVEVEETEFGLNRDELVGVLHAEKIRARRYFYPGCHRLEPYATRFPDAGERLPVTETIASRVISLPTGSAVDAGMIEDVSGMIRFVAAHAEEIKARLPA